MRQSDLFRREFHAVFCERDLDTIRQPGYKSPVLFADSLADLRGMVDAKLRLDDERIAYAILCQWTGAKVIKLSTVQRNSEGKWTYG